MTSSPQTDSSLLLGMFRGARSAAAEPRQNPAASDYDWQRPYRFTPAQAARLGQFAQQCAEKLSAVLCQLLRTPTALQAGPVTEHYAPRLRRGAPGATEYCLALRGKDGKGCGVLAVGQGLALGWVARLLGAAPAEGAGPQDMSALEGELLLDLLGRLAGAFWQHFQAAGGAVLQAGESLAVDDYCLPGGETDDYCRIALLPSGEGSDPQAGLAVIVSSEAMLPVAGKTASAGGTTGDPRKDMLVHLGRAAVAGRMMLGTAAVAMRDIAQLQVGDIVVLDRRADEPVELLVQGKVVLTGYLSGGDGRYALAVWRGPAGPVAAAGKAAGR